MNKENDGNVRPYYRILSHPLVMAVLENTSPLHLMLSTKIENSGKSGADIKSQSQQILSDIRSSDYQLYSEFNYHNEVFHYVGNLTHAMERLEMTPIFLGRFPRTTTFDKSGITIHKWIQYHYSNYIVTVTSIYDTALLLINAIFSLGIEPRLCNDKTVGNNEQVKRSTVKKALDGLGNTIKPYRDPRHFFVHRNVIPGLSLLDDLEDLRFVEEISKELKLILPEDLKMGTRLTELRYQHQRRLLIKEILKGNDRVAGGVYGLFDELHPVYSKFSTKLRKNG